MENIGPRSSLLVSMATDSNLRTTPRCSWCNRPHHVRVILRSGAIHSRVLIVVRDVL